ncbi:MAG: hypothetical protein ABH859_02150 [Pseudomonadota bacterium]
MGININRLREKIRLGSDKHSQSVSDLPLDHRLTFNPSPDQQWNFEDDHVYYNGQDINDLINEYANDIGCLNGISLSLDEYRQYVWENFGRGNAKYNSTIDALLGKVLGRLGNIYDGLVGGVSFEFSNGDFWLNNVNVRTVLNLYRVRPTNKARCYLVGLRNKLGLILASQNGNHRYHGVHEVAQQLFHEISCALDKIPTTDANFCLPAARAC